MRSTRKSPRIALALAGGGPLGAIYEIGALCALDEALEGIDFTRLDHYVGVSAGGFIAAALANGLTPREICASFIESRPGASDVFDPAWLLAPAWSEFARRAAMLPAVAASALWGALRGHPTSNTLDRLGRALPTGIFSNSQVDTRLAHLFSHAGRTNDFRKLRSKLTLVATQLDTGEAAPFGRPGWDAVPISKAVQASCALPGLFPPVQIGGHHYVDGALKKTLHASVALDDGVDLLLCLNPLVPFNVAHIEDGGLPAVLSQTFRSMIHSRMALGMKHYERAYPASDIVLFEPDQRDARLFLANTFGYAQRRELAEHAYRQTRALLRDRREGIAQKLERHGVSLRRDVLADPHRHLVQTPAMPSRFARAVTLLDETLGELELALQPA